MKRAAIVLLLFVVVAQYCAAVEAGWCYPVCYKVECSKAWGYRKDALGKSGYWGKVKLYGSSGKWYPHYQYCVIIHKVDKQSYWNQYYNYENKWWYYNKYYKKYYTSCKYSGYKYGYQC